MIKEGVQYHMHVHLIQYWQGSLYVTVTAGIRFFSQREDLSTHKETCSEAVGSLWICHLWIVEEQIYEQFWIMKFKKSRCQFSPK